MPFGPVNVPGFYLCMMENLKNKWDALFIEIPESYSLSGEKVDGKKVHIHNGNVHLDSNRLYSNTQSMIDNILVWSNTIKCILKYFECMCRVFQKYRVSFRQDKCHFLLDRKEYVGHNLLPNGKFPAQSKFYMINNWTLPLTSSNLHNFVGLVTFYLQYAPYL